MSPPGIPLRIERLWVTLIHGYNKIVIAGREQVRTYYATLSFREHAIARPLDEMFEPV